MAWRKIWKGYAFNLYVRHKIFTAEIIEKDKESMFSRQNKGEKRFQHQIQVSFKNDWVLHRIRAIFPIFWKTWESLLAWM